MNTEAERLTDLEQQVATLKRLLHRLVDLVLSPGEKTPPAAPAAQPEAILVASSSVIGPAEPVLTELEQLEQVQRDFAWLRSRRNDFRPGYGIYEQR